MRRYGRTVVSDRTAREAAYAAHLIGADRADYAGDCQSPVTVPLTGMSDRRLEALRRFASSDADYATVNGQTYWKGPGAGTPAVRHIDVSVRCRKCDTCLRARRRHWAARAQSEMGAAYRTWFGTLTLTPERQFHLICTARTALARGGTDYDSLSPEDQFMERCKPLVREVQLYWKRLRREGAAFRYMVAIERHKSGAPHVHVLVHEYGQAVRHRQLTAHWRWGFTKFNLVAEGESLKAARYVAKYITKSLTRMCASSGYGKGHGKLSRVK